MEMVKIAKRELVDGRGEQGVDNGGADVARYAGRTFEPGINYGSWCAYFASWCLLQAGHEIEGRARRGAKALVREVARQGQWAVKPGILRPTMLHVPQAGDVIAWHRGLPGSWMGHVGIVESYDAESDTLVTIEGNAGRFPARVQRKRYRHGTWRTRLYGVARSHEEKESR